MMQSVGVRPFQARLPLQALEAFPASLPIAGLPGLGEHLSDETIAKLRDIEGLLRKEVRVEPILRARTERGLEKAFADAWEMAVGYYIKSGILIWRALGHDYTKLLHLSRVSGKAVDRLFFQNARRLERDTFIKVVAGLRVLGRVGEGITQAEGKTEPAKRTMPVGYLGQVTLATFVTWCFLAYFQSDVKKARRANLRALAQLLRDIGDAAYKDAVQQGLYLMDAERAYWSPAWQEGEVEADLDVHLGGVKSFGSVEDLLRDLRGS